MLEFRYDKRIQSPILSKTAQERRSMADCFANQSWGGRVSDIGNIGWVFLTGRNGRGSALEPYRNNVDVTSGIHCWNHLDPNFNCDDIWIE